MNKLLTYTLIIVSFLLNGSCIYGQSPNENSVEQIDKFILENIEECENIDSLYTMAGTTIFWKRIIGIKIRTGKGISRNFTYFCDTNLLSYRMTQVEFKKSRNYHQIENYYFNSMDLIKYEIEYYSKDKETKKDSLLHKVDLFFIHQELVERRQIINDGFEIQKNQVERIINESIRIFIDSKKAIKPSS